MFSYLLPSIHFLCSLLLYYRPLFQLFWFSYPFSNCCKTFDVFFNVGAFSTLPYFLCIVLLHILRHTIASFLWASFWPGTFLPYLLIWMQYFPTWYSFFTSTLSTLFSSFGIVRSYVLYECFCLKRLLFDCSCRLCFSMCE